jgi:hypothetical protein
VFKIYSSFIFSPSPSSSPLDTPEGYVQISGFTDDASPTVSNRLKVGDRIIAVDSSFGGTMWPVSNVEGIVSSVTTSNSV